jgi:anti-sigma regulatory factor (Ser/Thr protein kinase)
MQSLRLSCLHPTDHVVAAALAKRYAIDVGFADSAASAVGIVVGELVSNAVRYAGAGTLELDQIPPPRPGVQITVRDCGPGLSAAQQATLVGIPKSDLYAEYGRLKEELGHGLGAVMRLLEGTQIVSSPSGTTISGCCFLRPR